MANTIQIKHGATAPNDGALQPYELGYSEDGSLYIGIPSGGSSVTKKIYDTNINNNIYINSKGYLAIKLRSDCFSFETMYTTTSVYRVAAINSSFQFQTITKDNFIKDLSLLTTSGGAVDTLEVTNGLIVGEDNYGTDNPNDIGKTGVVGQLYFVVTG